MSIFKKVYIPYGNKSCRQPRNIVGGMIEFEEASSRLLEKLSDRTTVLSTAQVNMATVTVHQYLKRERQFLGQMLSKETTSRT